MTAESFEKKIQKRSQWWNSIMDPIAGAGARIPDPSGYHTATYQYVKRITMPVNAAGCAGLRVSSPYVQGNGAGGADYSQYQVVTSGGTAASLGWGNITNTIGNGMAFDEVNASLGGNGSLDSLAALVRPVSACVMATYTGTSLSDAGTMCAYTNPGFLENSAVSADRLKSLYGSIVTPCKANKALVARLLPIQLGEAMIPVAAANLPAVAGTTCDYRDFIHANHNYASLGTPNPKREFGVFLTGATPSTGSVDFIIVVNFEFIPRFSSGSLLSTSPSPVDMYEEAFVMSTLDIEDATGTCSLKQFSEVPSASRITKAEREEISGPLSSMTGAVGFLGSIVETALPLIGALI